MLLLSANVTIGIESGMAKDNLAKGGKSTFYTLLVLLGINHLKSPSFFPVGGITTNAHTA